MRHETSKVSRESVLQDDVQKQNRTGGAVKLRQSHDPLENITCRIGNGKCAGRHITTARQTELFHPMNESRRIQSLLRLQRQYRNRFVKRIATGHRVQTKLRIGQSGDIYEREADEVANAATRMSGSQTEGVKRYDDDECLIPNQRRIFVQDSPGLPRMDPRGVGLLTVPPYTVSNNATAFVRKYTFWEWVIARNRRLGIDWQVISSPTFTRWHSITSLELSGGTWRRVNTPSGDANEIELGVINTSRNIP